MADGYHHLTYGSRCQIYALKKSGLSIRGRIARAGGVGLDGEPRVAAQRWSSGLPDEAGATVLGGAPAAGVLAPAQADGGIMESD